MPDFIPAYRPPTELAAKLVDQQQHANDPWVALINSMGQQSRDAITAYYQKKANTLNPQQQAAIGIRSPAQGPAQPGQPAPTMAGGGPAFANGMSTSLAEQILQRQTQEAIARGKVDSSHQVIDKTQAEALNKRSGGEFFYEGQSVDNRTLAGMLKPPASKASDNDESNRKILTDYAAAHNVSLDALRPGGMGGWNSSNLATVAEMIKNHPEYDIQGLKLAFEGKQAGTKSGASTTASKAADIKVNLDSAHSGFTKIMDSASQTAEKMGQEKVGLFNKAIQAGKIEFNDPDALALYSDMHMAAMNYARITKGGSASIGEDDARQAMKVLSNKLDKGGMKAVQDEVNKEYQGRLEGLPGAKKTSTPPVSKADPLGLGL